MLLALLIYLPTCAYIPLSLYLLLIAICVFLNHQFLTDFGLKLLRREGVTDKNFLYLTVFAAVGFILRLADIPNWESSRDIYSFVYLFPFTYIVAKTLKGRINVLKYLVYFTLLESGVAAYEYAIGVTTIFPNIKNYREFESYNLLYWTRMFGLSPNSSGLSIKYIYAMLLIPLVPFSQRWKIVLESIFVIASIFVFGRITLIVLLFYLVFREYDRIFVRKSFDWLKLVPLGILVLTFSVNPMWTAKQFTRNNIAIIQERLSGEDEVQALGEEQKLQLTKKLGLDKIDMSGRNEIWNTFLSYSFKNIHGGHMAKKFMIGAYHAHNSYIQLLCSVGLYLTAFMMFILLRNLTWHNYVFVGTLMFLAMGQYLIFWGISMFDILFYYLLFIYRPKHESGWDHS